jgi:UDP-2-acetamido-2,6-beta-L-arabino-hexul-4-ose reductase
MIKVGITGQSGFIGSHLYNYLATLKEIVMIPFDDDYFSNEEQLNSFTQKCTVIVHLAAVNRNDRPQVLYDTNLKLVNNLIKSLTYNKSSAHVIFSSSIQESDDNTYGRSKREGRRLFLDWERNSAGRFTGIIIPNVFGPHGKPNFNSFIATFSHNIIFGKPSKVVRDSTVNLIYINDLVKCISDIIISKKTKSKFVVKATFSVMVSEVLNKLMQFHDSYISNNTIPLVDNYFDLCLFNTLRSHLPHDYFPKLIEKHSDSRGSFLEVVRSWGQGQVSYSSTRPGITRGNHYHMRKIERFVVISGSAIIRLRRIGTEKIIEYIIHGKSPGFVDIPVNHTHSIKNIGEDELLTLFWINEHYDEDNSDTYFEDV